VSGFESAASASKPDGAGARSLLPGLAAIALGTFYVIVLLVVEEQSIIIALLAAGIVAAIAAHWTGMLNPVASSFIDREQVLSGAVVAAVVAITVYFHADHFILLLVTTILLYVLATLGLNLQFGYAGVLNFAGASFFGVGGYTAAVLSTHTAMPHILVLLTGGVMAAFIGLLVLLPVLRTRGHYAAVVTIAFALLFRTFLEVNDVLGGPQGLAVPGFELFGWSFNRNIDLFGLQLSFYVNYLLMALLLVIGAFVLVRRLERSWIGLNLDAQRLDETAAICFGLEIVRWKTTAFVLGNFLIGLAGALFAMMIGFIAPTNFTFADSLIFVSIVLLGGLGNPWGLVVATAIVVIIPEKLQAIQEYRFLLYAALVMLMLLFRPDGLLPRPVRNYFPGWRPR
jgi:ABC-type branched-subunit amino acid transport system permease subunit